MKISRRALIATGAAAVLAGCGGVKPYSDLASKNLTFRAATSQKGFWTKRNVYVDVYRGSEYLGTTEITHDGQAIGLPVGEPLILYVGFQENFGWGNSISHNTVEIPVTVRPGQRYALMTEFGQAGFAWDLKRI